MAIPRTVEVHVIERLVVDVTYGNPVTELPVEGDGEFALFSGTPLTFFDGTPLELF